MAEDLLAEDMTLVPSNESKCDFSRPAARSAVLAFTTITIFEAHDVILTQVGARLHFNDVQRNLARVFDAVLGAQGNVGGLIFLQQESLLPSRNPRCARHHYPMLGTVMMELQRHARTRLH